MELKNNFGNGKAYLSILADGKFHQVVPEGTEGAKIREYEDSEGVMKSKTELVFDEISGKITDVSFDDSGSFGKNLILTIDNEAEISVSTTGNFGEDLMKKLPAIDMETVVKLVPYSFTDDKGKSRKGVTVYQNEEKIENFYYNKETKKSINGIPEPEGDTKSFDSDDWKMHFMKVRKFLIKEVEDNIIKDDNEVKF